MKPIALTIHGEALKPLEGLAAVQDARVFKFLDDTEVATDVGVHAVCNGNVDLRRASLSSNVLCCRGCGLRVVIPRAIEMWSDLAGWANQQPSLQPWMRAKPGAGGDNLSDSEPRTEAEQLPRLVRTPLDKACITAVARLNDAGHLQFNGDDKKEAWKIIQEALTLELPARLDLANSNLICPPPVDPNGGWKDGDMVLQGFSVVQYREGNFWTVPSQLVAEIKGGEVILRVKLLNGRVPYRSQG